MMVTSTLTLADEVFVTPVHTCASVLPPLTHTHMHASILKYAHVISWHQQQHQPHPPAHSRTSILKYAPARCIAPAATHSRAHTNTRPHFHLEVHPRDVKYQQQRMLMPTHTHARTSILKYAHVMNSTSSAPRHSSTSDTSQRQIVTPRSLCLFRNAGPVAAAAPRCAVKSIRLCQLPVAAFLPAWRRIVKQRRVTKQGE